MKKFAAILLSLALVLTSVCALAAEPLLIGTPDDGTNLARALKLLEAGGFIEIDPNAGDVPEIKDVTKYIYNIEIMPVAANTLTSTLSDFAASIINSTYSVPVGLLATRDGLIAEQVENARESSSVNIICARTADKDNETYAKVVKAYQSQLVAEFTLIDKKGANVPVWDYDPDFTVEDEEKFLNDIRSYTSSKEGKTVVRVGVCGSGNDAWNACQKVLDEEGEPIYIELVEFDAYTLPNEALNSGDIDLNSFQHKAFLAKDIAGNGYEVEPIGDTVVAPLAVYSQKYKTLDELKDAAGLL